VALEIAAVGRTDQETYREVTHSGWQSRRGMHNMMQSDSIPQEQEGLHKYTGLLQTDVTQASAE